jgi:hypothetical protein
MTDAWRSYCSAECRRRESNRTGAGTPPDSSGVSPGEVRAAPEMGRAKPAVAGRLDTGLDVVEAALGRAIDAEVQARAAGWEARVALLAGELQARRREREGVPTLLSKTHLRRD